MKVEIEVPDMVSIGACGQCMHALLWLVNLDNHRVFAAYVDDRDRTVLHLHRCRPLQAPATWKSLAAVPDPDQAQRNAAGRQAVEQALKSKPSSTEGAETP